MTSIVKAEATTVLKRDGEGDKTAIQKREEHVLSVPHQEILPVYFLASCGTDGGTR
jgi:hypothetical protein